MSVGPDMETSARRLKARLKEREALHDEQTRIRIHRAISWLARAETEEEDRDARFIFLWIAFNAAYAREFGFEQTERETLREFLGRVLAVDAERRLHGLVFEKFSGPVRVLIDNHEFNAIAWSLPDPRTPGDFLRTQQGELGRKNRHQHARFLEEVEGRPEHEEIIDWFLTLPLWLDLRGLRVVHACWSQAEQIALAGRLAAGERLSRELMEVASCPGADEYRAVECLLKGLEIPLPDGASFQDKDGFTRTQVRVRWWDTSATTYRAAAMVGDSKVQGTLPETPIPPSARIGYEDSKPVFFGHYWFKGPPRVLSSKAACVDYSVAKGGPLVAYRWSGEENLRDEHFVASERSS